MIAQRGDSMQVEEYSLERGCRLKCKVKVASYEVIDESKCDEHAGVEMEDLILRHRKH